jgi:hypothetical protein
MASVTKPESNRFKFDEVDAAFVELEAMLKDS